MQEYMIIEPSGPLEGTVSLSGAKNAVLPIMASLLLTRGKSTLYQVPYSDDVKHMILLLRSLGAEVTMVSEEKTMYVDTTHVSNWQVAPEIMNKMRASILVMGPLLATFGKSEIALPGGCVIGTRPIDFHLALFKSMGVKITQDEHFLSTQVDKLQAQRLILEYPSVGATENCLMAAVLTDGCTTLVNAALEPEVLDLIQVLKKMGARIDVKAPAHIEIQGVTKLHPVEHTILVDRLEAGAFLLAGAMTGGDITIDNFPHTCMDVFLHKLQHMGHHINEPKEGGLRIKGVLDPRSVSFKTGSYPCFPTDLQAPTMAALTVARGTSVVEETVFENRFLHVQELIKLGAQITVEHTKAIIRGVEQLYGTSVIATDIRASCALMLIGLVAHGPTFMAGLHHWRRGYDGLEDKLKKLGASIAIVQGEFPLAQFPTTHQATLSNR